ncbi:MAG: ABC transporter permease [Chthoniobacterales bacterium]
MFRFLTIRALQAIPVLLIIATMTFFMVHAAPGGPFSKERKVTPEVLRNLNAQYGLDQPLWKQYGNYLWKAVHGDLGPSYKYANRTVSELIGDSFPVSAELGFWAMLIALAIGLPAGILAALKPNSWLDYLPMSIAMLGICIPTFVLGPVLALTFGIRLEWFDASGWFSWRDRVLPAITLGFFTAAYIARLTRGGMLDVMNQDFIRTARAKGASELRVLFHHALRGGLLPVISYLGPAIAAEITGSFVVETIFNVPGLGRYFILSAFNRDYTMVLGTVLFYASIIILLNLVVDVLQVLLNPRLRFD